MEQNPLSARSMIHSGRDCVEILLGGFLLIRIHNSNMVSAMYLLERTPQCGEYTSCEDQELHP